MQQCLSWEHPSMTLFALAQKLRTEGVAVWLVHTLSPSVSELTFSHPLSILQGQSLLSRASLLSTYMCSACPDHVLGKKE